MNTPSATPQLRRDLGLWGAAAIVVGTVIGSGIFLVPTTMVKEVGSVQMVFVVWIVGGLLSLFGALTYAELAAAMPEAGGEYVFLQEAYGPVWGFIYGWTQTLVAKSGSIATLAAGFFRYLTTFWPGLVDVVFKVGPVEVHKSQLLAMVLIMGLAGINYYGLKLGGGVQIVVTLLKVLLILLIVGVGMFWGQSTSSTAPVAAAGGVTGFFAALVAALWAYDGWNNVSMVSSEIKNPRRNLPIALIWGTLTVMAIYMVTNLAYFRVLSPAEVAGADRVAVTMMERVLGHAGAAWVAVAAMISMFAALNGSILSGSRVPYAMARDGVFFRSLARVHPTHHTPGIAIIVLSAWSALLVVCVGTFEELFNYVIFASWILYGMTTASVIVLRKKRPDMPRPYRTLGYPVVPVLFVLAALGLVISTLIHSPRESYMGIFLILIGLPFYFYWKRRASGERVRVP